MASRVARPSRQFDYNRFDPALPIVIDNGGSCFRIGWAGESEPRTTFRHTVQRPRHKATGETVTIIGDYDPALMKYFDCTRSPPRSAFDSNVVYQFEIMEYVLDFGFERLGADGLEINHPILMTECVCNPAACRSRMAELLFETYGVPSIAFGIDVAFSYKYNQRLGVCNEDGLAICPGFTTSHVIPFLKGEPIINACCRTNVGGNNITEYLKQLLSLKYPHHIENPELYLEQLRSKYKELSEKVEQRKRLKISGTHTNGNGGVGRGERLNAAQRERMRLLTTAALDRGKGEDTFGAKEEDWQLYKLMSRDNDDDDDDNGNDEEEAELARVTSRLQEIDPTFIAKSDTSSLQGTTPEVARIRPMRAEDFQVVLGVERFRCPEILFQPPMVGVHQAGLDEMTGFSLRRLSVDEGIKERMCKSILMTGGSCLLPGIGPRLEADIRKIRPYLSPLRMVRASDPILDAWRGAAMYAASLQFPQHAFSKQDYDEKGEDWLRGYQLTYSI